MKKTLWVVFFIVLVFFLYQITDTFGLLETKSGGGVTPTIGKWEIELNDIDITLEKVLTINDLIYEENDNVEDGYFAPGVRASYDIIINPKDTDVSIRYDVTPHLDILEDHSNIYFDMSVEDDNLVKNGNTYSGVIPLSAIKGGEVLIIRISLVWEDSEEYDDEDSSLIDSDVSLVVPIMITFSQYVGEEL